MIMGDIKEWISYHKSQKNPELEEVKKPFFESIDLSKKNILSNVTKHFPKMTMKKYSVR